MRTPHRAEEKKDEIVGLLQPLFHLRVISYFHAALGIADQCVLRIVEPLTLAILLSGLDDLSSTSSGLHWIRSKFRPNARMFPPGRRSSIRAPAGIAILVPLWHEYGVIGDMIEHNIASIRYPDYHVFAGAIPMTIARNRRSDAAARFRMFTWLYVPTTVRPPKGLPELDLPASLLYEERTLRTFRIVLTHDAED